MNFNDILSHHGIKGQQWGVRNAEWYPIADYKKHMNRTSYKKGQRFYRISSSQEDSDSDRKFKYVSSTQRDRDYYKGLYSQDIMFDPDKYTKDMFANTKLKDIVKDFNTSGRHLYEIEYKAISDIRAPTKEQRKKIYDSMLDNDKDLLDDISNTLKNDPWFKRNFDERLLDAVVYKAGTNKKRQKDLYQFFNLAVGTPDSIVMDKLIKELKKNGFNAIQDDNDAGEITDKPLIILDPGQFIERTCSNEIFAEDIGRAYNRTMERLAKRRRNLLDNYELLNEDEWR